MNNSDISLSIVVGITGGIGTGKSSVANILTEMQFKVIDTDQLANDLMLNNKKLKNKIITEFGEKAFDGNQLNKEFLSAMVFDENNANNLDKLNSIVHPFVIDDMYDKAAAYANEGEKLIFIESALIFEAGLEDGFDYIVVVDASKRLCIERVKSRTGLSSVEIEKRMNRQIPQEQKIANADFIIDNSSDINQLKSSVKFIIEVLKALPPKSSDE